MQERAAVELYKRLGELPAAAPLLARLGDATGVHLVGGAVRDLLRGGRPEDLDLVAEVDPQVVAAKLGGEVVNHDRFGTATVTLDRFGYDIARARRETYPRPGALPEVMPAPLAEDLLRRDFTVNAIALALGGEKRGTLTAAPQALEDLAGGRLRVLHDASFKDDPTRLLRLARYASRLGFEPEPHTRALIDQAVTGRFLQTVSGARVGRELRLLAAEPDPVAALLSAGEFGLDRAIHPGLGLDDEQLARRALALLPADGRPDRLVLALAARRLTADALAELLDQLAFEAADREAIIATAREAPERAQLLAAARTPSEIATALAGADPELVAAAGALGPAEAAERWLTELRGVRLEIDGRDLIGAGVDQGPALGRALSAALAAKLDGKAAGREEQLAVALAAARRADA